VSSRPKNRTLTWFARHETTVFLSLLVVIGGIWGFVSIANDVVAGDTLAMDHRILLALRNPTDVSLPIGPAWLGETVRDVTALGGFAVLILITSSVILFYCLDRNFRAARFIAISIVGGFLISVALKSAFERPRPDIVPHLADASMSSFPSAHSMMSAIVYLTLGTLLARTVDRDELKLFIWGLALLLTLTIGMSRVYIGVHYPTDVLAGWSAGFAWATFCGLVARRFGISRASCE
jgi:undecaprenyl-diphosphatase